MRFFLTTFLVIFGTTLFAQLDWAHRIGDVWLDEARGMDVDAQGNVYVVGTYEGTVDFDPGIGTATFSGGGHYVLKFSPAGVLLWAQAAQGDSTKAYEVKVDGSGNVCVIGFYLGTVDFDFGPGVSSLTSMNNWNDIFVQKLDRNGNFIWAKSIGSDAVGPSESGWSINTDSRDNVYLTGFFFSSNNDFDPGPGVYSLPNHGGFDVFLLKLDSAGDFKWAQSYGSSGHDYGRDIAFDENDNVYLVGEVYNAGVDFDYGPGVQLNTAEGGFLLKLDSAGNFKYLHGYQGAGPISPCPGGGAYPRGVAVNNDGEVIVAGGFYGQVDFDPGPNTNIINSINCTTDIFAVKSDSSGNFIWARRIEGGNEDNCTDIDVDNAGFIYLAGTFEDNLDLDFSMSVNNMVSFGEEDAYILKLNPTGQFSWAGHMGGPGTERGFCIDLDPNGNIFYLGYLWLDIGDYDPFTPVHTIAPAGGGDGFLLKLRAITGLNEFDLHAGLNVFPNPSTDMLYINTKEEIFSLALTDINGKTIFTSSTNTSSINLGHLAPGLYILSVYTKKGIKSKRIIKH